MKILISDSDGHNAYAEKQYLLESELGSQPGFEVEIYPYCADGTGNAARQEFINRVSGADALITAFVPIDKNVIDAAAKAKKLKCISLDATGFSNVDTKYAKEKNITVMAIEEYCTKEVAEHAISLIMALNRGLKFYTKDVEQNNNWDYSDCYNLKRVEGQKLGIFGYGRIGKEVAKKAKALGMKVYFYDEYVKTPDSDTDIIKTSPQYILENCDIISNHMVQTKENYHYFNRQTFSTMRQHPVFINVARGAAVDEEALCEALDNGTVRGAGLDVLSSEIPDLKSCRLLRRDNVIITPHSAFFSEQSEYLLRKTACDNLINYFKGRIEKIHRIVN